MKIVSETMQPDGTVRAEICKCKGATRCKPKDRLYRVFKSVQSMLSFKHHFCRNGK